MSDTLSVCYVLSYYSPDYVRTRTLVAALRAIPGLSLYEARNTSTDALRYLQTLWKLLVVRLKCAPRYYVLGFRGYELFWPVRLLTLGHPLVYDQMMSPYDSLVHEHRRLHEGSLVGRIVHLYEKGILHAADRVLTDTDCHRRFLHEAFDLPLSKIDTIPVGADEGLFSPRAARRRAGREFEVLFYGSFLPLHGVETVLRAAALLRDDPIRFTLVGGSAAARRDAAQLAGGLGLTKLTQIDWIDFVSLPELIASSDLGLGGPFGNTGQARRVITGKTFQFLAMGRPVVVGETDVDTGFVDKANCLLVPQADPAALADAVAWASGHPSELARIGQAGRDLYKSRYSIERISQELRRILT